MPAPIVRIDSSGQEAVKGSKKQDHYSAGKQKLAEFRKKRAEKRKQVPAVIQEGSIPVELSRIDGSVSSAVEGNTMVQIDAGVANNITESGSHVLADGFSSIENNGDTYNKNTFSEIKVVPPLDDDHQSQVGAGDNISASKSSLWTGGVHSHLSNGGDQGVTFPVTPFVNASDKGGKILGHLFGQKNLTGDENGKHDQAICGSSGGTSRKEHMKRESLSEVVADGLLYNKGKDWKAKDMPILNLSSSLSSDQTIPKELAGVGRVADFSLVQPECNSVTFLNKYTQNNFDFFSTSSVDASDRRPANPKEMSVSSVSALTSGKSELRENFTPLSIAQSRKPDFREALTSRPPYKLFFTPETASDSLVLSRPLQPIDNTSMCSLEEDIAFVNHLEENKSSRTGDFAELEQLIDDLTQEKFSLQHALDAARSLGESLAAENSALTENFNSQGSMVTQLQEEVQRLKEEIKSQSVVVSKFMVEREKAQQESNSAMERSHMLAGEVISLEEKVLKLRSSELKFQRDLESVKEEADSSRVCLAALEKDKLNLQSMVDALQEEKSMFLKQLQRNISIAPTSVSGKESKDVCTSTDDLEVQVATTGITEELICLDNQNEHAYPLLMGSDFNARPSFTITSSKKLSSNPSSLHAKNLKTINNIDSLITELFIEKGSLLESLRRESSRARELEALNVELSRKLETQTQRLELVFAQNAAQVRTSVFASAPEEQQDSEFVDEGAEVVERVLGWIMRLFPGGSSKRRTSRLL